MAKPLTIPYHPALHKVKTASSMINIAGCGGLDFSSLVEVWGPPKCHCRGSRVLRHDESLVRVEDVQVGDQLLGPDGQPRTVTGIHTGRGPIYCVRPLLDDPQAEVGIQLVNGSHEVAVCHHDGDGQIFTVPARELAADPGRCHGLALVKKLALPYDVGAVYQIPAVDPWLAGLLVSHRVGGPHIDHQLWLWDTDLPTTCDLTLQRLLDMHCGSLERFSVNGRPAYRLVDPFSPLQDLLHQRDPQLQPYVAGSPAVRTAFLRGLLRIPPVVSPADPEHVDFHSYSHAQLLMVLRLAWSLGWRAQLIRTSDGTGRFRFEVARVWNRRASDPLGRLDYPLAPVEQVCEDDFVGFTVSGPDHYYLDEFRFVTHNSGKSTFCYQTAGLFLQQYGERARVLINDAESSANPLRLKRVFGIGIGNDPYVRTVDRDPRVMRMPAATIEQAVENILVAARAAARDNAFLLTIWDSVTVSRPRREKEFMDAAISAAIKQEAGDALTKEERDAAKAGVGSNMSIKQLHPQMLKWAVNQIIDASYGVPVITFMINQATTDLSGFMPQVKSGGGFGLKHNIHYSLRFKFEKKLGDNLMFHAGTLAKMRIEKSKMMPSSDEIEVFIRDDLGGLLEPTSELMYAAASLKLLAQAGGKYTMPHPPDRPLPDGYDPTKSKTLKELAANPAAVAAVEAVVEQYLRNAFSLVDWAYQERDAVRADFNAE